MNTYKAYRTGTDGLRTYPWPGLTDLRPEDARVAMADLGSQFEGVEVVRSEPDRKIKARIRHHQNATEIKFDYGYPHGIYLLESELCRAANPTEMRMALFDISSVILLERGRMDLIKMDQMPCDSGTRFNPDAYVWYFDTRRFFGIVRMLREKKIEADLSLDRFRIRGERPRRLSVMEIVRHSNARGEMAKTLAHCHRHIFTLHPEPRREWDRLIQDYLSSYLPYATVCGQVREFYFDGRRPEGCGFNGGFIPHQDGTIGAHT